MPETTHTFTAPDGLTLPYILHTPPGDRPAAGWPFLLYLHGMGERGADLVRVRIHGIPKVTAADPDFPFLALSPQCPLTADWRTSTPALAALFDHALATLPIDPARVYVTGLSMGGFGTWALGIERADRIAAIAPICGGGDPTRVCALRRVPVWAFHGALDDVVPLELSQVMVDALRGCGGDVRLTVYPDAAHDSWTQTYANPDLYAWLLAQRREST